MAESDYSFRPVYLPVRMEQLGYHLTDFHEIWYLRIFRNSGEKIQLSLYSEKNKLKFTWRWILNELMNIHFDRISLTYS